MSPFDEDDDFYDDSSDNGLFHDDIRLHSDGPLDSDSESSSMDDEDSQELLEFEEEENEEEDLGEDMGAGQTAGAGNMVDKVLHVLHLMAALGMDVPSFLDALSWGDDACIKNPTIRTARTKLLKSDALPGILRRWWNPPSPSQSRRPSGGRDKMESFVTETFTSVVDSELEALAPLFTSPTGDDISEEELTSVVFSETSLLAHQHAPNLCSLLHDLAYTPTQRKKNAHKDPQKIELITLSTLSYARNHHRNRFQKFFAFYFKFRGITAKGFDTLHALGLTMSHKWTCNAIGRMSARAMEERLDNQSQFGSGAAATVYIKRDAKQLSSTANRDFQEKRAEGMKNPITGGKIYQLAHVAEKRIQPHILWQILKVILDHPEFDFATYKFKDSSSLNPPHAVDELPVGIDHVTLQFLLGSVNIPEAGYEDNSRLIQEWLRQLGLNTPENVQKLSLEQLIAWIGDQLTIDRLRKLFKFRAEDLNSYDRLDWVVLVFGWLHLMMAFANTLHKQYMGTAHGRGLSQAFDLLTKKGLGTSSIQGPFYHDLNEILYHKAAAHLREDWCFVAGIQHIHELRDKTPTELLDLAEVILQKHASNEALSTMAAQGEDQQDEVKQQTIMWNRDILHYIVLDQAIKNGDVGLMEDFLPHLLFRFIGGGSSNYTIEVLELLQALHREWPDELKQFVRHSCWLVNFHGKRSTHLPIDKAQEHNIKRVKVNYRSEGPSINWEYMHKLHPAIPIIDAVASHIEEEFKTVMRGKKHTVPKAELDIQALHKSYRSSDVHKYIPGRKHALEADHAKDFIAVGALELGTGKLLQRWVDGRSFRRSTTQEFNLPDSDDSDESSTT
ncbi:hypothetical protein Hypma_005135 [Hypsizygus marmoreus]|uniref:DUF6589 domain-containing protein n=1 Tax=Hypsizygus marmoreus TaxID=39966 RepID=A0A369K0K1_HYPMA|nr:hypothetical protein Hypma_005135 [Hypsizygus marmoreus]